MVIKRGSDSVTKIRESEGLGSVVGLMLAGLAIVVFAFMMAVPPFGGTDEFDHAFRAAAVAHGQWITNPTDAVRGTGSIVRVPASLVASARPQCSMLPYTTPEACGVGLPQSGWVEVPSGAGRYHPLYYFLVGLPTLVLSGDSALWGMRIVSALLFLALVLMGLGIALRQERPELTAVGYVLAMTPMAVYSGSMVNPSGVEIAAAVGFWVTGRAVLDNSTRKNARLPLWRLVTFGAVLATVRSLGPLWVLMLSGILLLSVNRPMIRLRILLRRRTVFAPLAFLFLSVAQSLVWIASEGSLVIGVEPKAAHMPWGTIVEETIAGVTSTNILQLFAAFPFRNQIAPVPTYVIWLSVSYALIAFLLFRTTRRSRLAVLLVIVLCILVPAVFEVATWRRFGDSWEGRYTLPLYVGAPLIAALASRSGTGRQSTSRLTTWVWSAVVGGAGVLVAAANLIAVEQVLKYELTRSPSVRLGVWPVLAPPLVAILMVVGTTLCWTAVGTFRLRSTSRTVCRPSC